MIEIFETKMKKLDFEYCECGCHNHAATMKGMHYTIYNDLQGNYTARRGHSILGFTLGVCKSFKAAENLCQKDYDKTP